MYKNIDNLSVVELQDRPEFTEECIEYIWTEWKDDYIFHSPYATKELLYKYIINRDATETPDSVHGSVKNKFPKVFLLLDNNESFVSFLMIDTDDCDMKKYVNATNQNSIWLCNLFTLPKYRRKGYMTFLIFYIIHNVSVLSKCCNLTEPIDVYLYTEYQLLDYYLNFGFSIFVKVPKVDSQKGETTTKFIMRRGIPILSP